MDVEFEIPHDDPPTIYRDAPQPFGLLYPPMLILALIIAIPLVIWGRVRAAWNWLVGY